MGTEPAGALSLKEAKPPLRVLGERPIVVLAVYLMLGIVAGAYLPAPPAIVFLILLTLIMACAVLFALKRDCTLIIVAAAFVAGYALLVSALPAWAGDSSAPAGTVEVRARVEETGQSSGGSRQYTLTQVRVGGQNVEGSVLLTVGPAAAKAQPGDAVAFQAKLARPAPSAYFGGFNYRGYCLRRGILFTAFAASLSVEQAATGAQPSLPERMRAYSSGVLSEYLSPDAAGLVDALISGNKSGISDETGNSFIELGVAHLLAVSGLNITLTAGAAWLLLRKLRVPMPVSWAVSAFVMVLYVLFAGFTPSVERAAVMWLVMMAALALGRRYDPLSSIAAAAVIILAVSPLDLFDAGFQLSFAATAAMFLWLAPLTRFMPQKRWMKYILSGVGVTACVTLFALPIILNCFNTVSLSSPLANLVLVPTSFVLQLAGTALLCVGFLPGVAQMLGGVVNGFANFYLTNVKLLDWSAATLHAATPPLWLVLVFVVLVAVVSPSLVRMKLRARLVAVAALVVAALLMLVPLPGALTGRGEATVVSLTKTSQGIYWRQDGCDYAACTGSPSGLVSYLKSRGITRLGGLYVLSAKPPKDGSELLEAADIDVDRLFVPDAWLTDPAARLFLEQGAALGMRALPAGPGPVPWDQASGALTLRAAGGRLAYLPKATGEALAAALDARVIVLGTAPDGELDMTQTDCRALIAPGDCSAYGVAVYNGYASGSLEIVEDGERPVAVPWRTGWENGIQGNFR